MTMTTEITMATNNDNNYEDNHKDNNDDDNKNTYYRIG